jgi:hypothetical protein
VKLQVSFGKGKEGFWSNVFPSPLSTSSLAISESSAEYLKLIKWTMPVLGLVPIRVMLRMFFFSNDFGDKMVYPLIALFLGTGNQTANVACAILERLFDDANMKLWDYDPNTLLPNLPTMVTFPKLDQFYKDWAADLRSKGVDIQLNTDVTAVSRSKAGVTLQTRPFDPNRTDREREHNGPQTTTESYDELVMCILADDAKRLLGKSATWKGEIRTWWRSFLRRHYNHTLRPRILRQDLRDKFNPELCAEPKTKAQEAQIRFAKNQGEGQDWEAGGFRPMYYTHSYKSDPKKIEMSFDCTNYQHQFRIDHDANEAPIPYEKHVFQSIFLDKTQRHLWIIDQIDETKIIERK